MLLQIVENLRCKIYFVGKFMLFRFNELSVTTVLHHLIQAVVVVRPVRVFKKDYSLLLRVLQRYDEQMRNSSAIKVEQELPLSMFEHWEHMQAVGIYFMWDWPQSYLAFVHGQHDQVTRAMVRCIDVTRAEQNLWRNFYKKCSKNIKCK